jgi:tetratricopeptide (TPR) repeat protein
VAAAEPEEKGESESGAGVERKSLLATKQLSAADAASRAYELYKSGSALLLSGDAPAAAEAYLNALRTDPKGAAGYRGLGLAYAEMGNSAAAIRYLRHYLKLAGSAPDRNLIVKRVRLMVLAAHED